MFIRKRKNKSGSISIQIIDKSSGRYKVVKHVGTSSSCKELDNLLDEAHDFLNKDQPSLFNTLQVQDILNKVHIIDIAYVGYEEVFGHIFNLLRYDTLTSNPLLEDLVIARIAYPKSKLSIHRWLKRKLGRNLSKDQIYRFMDTLDKKMEQQVSDHTYKFMKKVLKEKIHVIFFDATTVHFETFESDSFRKTGFSKVGKHNQPQIVVGLMVTTEGLPVGYDVYPGNEWDGHTIRSALRRVSRRYEVDKVVFVADSAMLSEDNVKIIESMKFQYIMAARIKSMSDHYKQKILNPDNYKKDVMDIKYGSKQRLIVSYSEDRARKDKRDRDKNLEQIKKRLTKKQKVTKSKVGKIGKSKYLEIVGNARIAISYTAVEEDARWDGLKGYMTNITKKEMKADMIISKYMELWQIEQAFRVAKSELNIRPVYHYKRKRIRAHILLVFMSLVVSRYTEYLLRDLGITTRRLLEYLEVVQEIRLGHPDTDQTVIRRSPLTDVLEEIYSHLKIC
jgi:transposase